MLFLKNLFIVQESEFFKNLHGDFVQGRKDFISCHQKWEVGNRTLYSNEEILETLEMLVEGKVTCY